MDDRNNNNNCRYLRIGKTYHRLFEKKLNGLKTIVIGSAYSIDKYYRIAYGDRWFADEQPSEKIKASVEKRK